MIFSSFFHWLKEWSRGGKIFRLPLALFAFNLIALSCLVTIKLSFKDFTSPAFDRKILFALYQLRRDFLSDIFLWLTLLFNVYGVLVMSLFLSFIFFIRRKSFYFLPFWLNISASAGAVWLIKNILGRARPLSEIQYYAVDSYSFPSGHAALALSLCGFALYFFWRESRSKGIKIFSSAVCLFLILAVGFSRLYLGVHYLSDVLAGYLVAALWLAFAVSLTESHNRPA